MGLGLVVAPFSAQEPESLTERSKVIAALERLMMTGHPGHNSHDEGAWLQEAVDIAIRANDSEIERLAYRAAVPLLVGISQPVCSIKDVPGFHIQTPLVLHLPYGVRYKAQIFASVDGGETFLAGMAPVKAGTIGATLPEYARTPGLHHVRLHARIVYEATGPVKVPDETRQLPDAVYAVYDPTAAAVGDARVFVLSPAWTSARHVHPGLPDVPFLDWLNGVLAKHLGKSDPSRDWLSEYCDTRRVEQGLPPRSRELCSVVFFGAHPTIGQIWIRTGRIDIGDSGARWVAEVPTFEAFILEHGEMTEYDDLSMLPALLATDPDRRPKGDASVTPEDIAIAPSRSRPGWMTVSATVRNAGGTHLRGVELEINAASADLSLMRRAAFVVDVPSGGSAEITAELPMPAPYGAVTVNAFQMSEHAPYQIMATDPTPDDAHAFRIVNRHLAPADYAARIRREFGSDSFRGY